jgi:hypothetical protein
LTASAQESAAHTCDLGRPSSQLSLNRSHGVLQQQPKMHHTASGT